MMKQINQINFELNPFDDPQNYTNGTEYLNCFYSNLFMFLGACGGKNVDKYIANNIFYYGYVQEKLDIRYRFEVQTLSCIKNEILYRESGIEITNDCVMPQKVMDYIYMSIENNIPVMVNVDLYFLSYRPDRFMKVHTSHFVMVYGFNFEKKEIYIYDNPKNQKYYQCIMKQDEFIAAFQYIYEPDVSNVFQYRDVEKESRKYSIDDCAKIFLKNVKKNRRWIFECIDNIDRLVEEFTVITKSESSWNLYKENLFYLMHYHILNKKKSELYAFYHFFGDSVYVEYLKEIVNLWEDVRNICSYSNLHGNYKKEMVKKGIEDMKKIKKKEIEFIKQI